MKYIFNRLLIAFIFVTLTASAAFAKSGRATVTFSADTNVSGTLVKKGTYEIKFDDKTKELSIVKNGKAVAKTTARTEQREHKSDKTQLRTQMEGANHKLIAIAFGGSDQEVVL